MINVTKAYLPNKEKYLHYVDQIFQSAVLTNNGPLTAALQERLETYLGVKNLLLVSSGTVALQLAYRALNLDGEVITTPFSYATTASSQIWQGLTPRFADINPLTMNIDVEKVPELINNKTSAIVPVHVFGNACDVRTIDALAKRHGLKVIYDAAHAFGVRYEGKSLLGFGDISILSFHATKLFHTVEGGAIIVNDDGLYDSIRAMLNCGYDNGEIVAAGINAKMNEFEAAMGLCILDEIDTIFEKREKVCRRYQEDLKGLVAFQQTNPRANTNYAYMPVFFKSGEQRQKVQDALKAHNIYPRRYFHPSLDTLDFMPPRLDDMSHAHRAADRVLCLPLYHELTENEQMKIIEIIKGSL